MFIRNTIAAALTALSFSAAADVYNVGDWEVRTKPTSSVFIANTVFHISSMTTHKEVSVAILYGKDDGCDITHMFLIGLADVELIGIAYLIPVKVERRGYMPTEDSSEPLPFAYLRISAAVTDKLVAGDGSNEITHGNVLAHLLGGEMVTGKMSLHGSEQALTKAYELCKAALGS